MPLQTFLIKTRLNNVIFSVVKPFNKIYQYLYYLKWVSKNKQKGFNDYYNHNADYHNRYKLHDAIQDKFGLKSKPIGYYEFGVAEGDMIKHWVKQNNNPDSSFVGYDSFEGLPEGWTDKQKGHFDTKGKFPEVNDTRVSFVKGWFQDTVPQDLLKRDFTKECVFHLDADLFNSTLFVLFQLHPYLKKGDILIFDEFSSYEHEFKALEIFKQCTGRDWEFDFVGAINNFRQTAIQIV